MHDRGRLLLISLLVSALLSAPVRARATVPYVGSFSGDVGVYVARIDPVAGSFTPLASDEYEADQSFPLASSFKPVVLNEVLRRIDAGASQWKTKIEIPTADHSLDDGRIPKRSSLKRLAKKMIKVSHNTSTDLLFKHVGLGAPGVTLAGWGLTSTRIVMPTREF